MLHRSKICQAVSVLSCGYRAIKLFSHTLNITSSYVTRFASGQDVEIDDTDVEVDDFGVSVTLFGRSQVPFDGVLEVQIQTNGDDPRVFTNIPEVLTLNRDDTVGIIRDDMAPGTYHVNILVKTLDGEILDRYETVLLIPERAVAVNQPTQSQTPGTDRVITLVDGKIAYFSFAGLVFSPIHNNYIS
ncbi:MAG: hypothetical protein M8349_05615 [ANME-2 cluster archaeon]|nr:hypothetical protein [ANME-2 cluster archaeon]